MKTIIVATVCMEFVWNVYSEYLYSIQFFAVSFGSQLEAGAKKEFESFKELQIVEGKNECQKILRYVSQYTSAIIEEISIWTYATGVYEILLQICYELEKHEDFPISVNEAKKLHVGLRKSIEYGLKPFLLGVATSIDTRIPYIIASVEILLKIVNNKFFPLICTRNDQHLVYTDLLSSIFIVVCYANDDIKTQFEEHLSNVKTKLTNANYFKVLFLIKGSNIHSMNEIFQKLAHKQLMDCLYRCGSFKALCEALLPSITSLDQDEEIAKKRLQCCKAISGIIARRGHPKQFFHQIIDEIFEHLVCFIRSNKSHQLYYTDVGVHCLNKLCSLRLKSIHNHILDLTVSFFKKFKTPEDVIAGAIVCEYTEFVEAVALVHLTFCATGPADDTLPSEFLTPFMPMFIQIYYHLNETTNKILKNQILSIIVRCLSNRTKDELNRTVECILYEEFEDDVMCLHPRIKIEQEPTGEKECFKLSISSNDIVENNDRDLDINSFLMPSTSMVNVLKQSEHNMLIYNVFLHLLQMFSDNFVIPKKSSSNNELLELENSLETAIKIKFKRKYAVIHALNELISFKSFHGQFAENPHDIVTMLDKMLESQIDQIQSVQKSNQKLNVEDFEEVLIVILSIVGDFMLRVQNDEAASQLKRTLHKLSTTLQNEETSTVLRKLNSLLDKDTKHHEGSAFSMNKSILCETHSEPYTRVYAIMNMIKLIEAKDEETCLNAHIVLALAMKTLKEADSYVFLNCIKLLVALFGILEETVLETLIAEYHSDIDSDSVDIDYKLKVGETIVKVTQQLGEMCFKYKSILGNCFLRGAYHKNDEFRASNMSSLGVMMRILSYQVHHFFQEVRNNAFLTYYLSMNKTNSFDFEGHVFNS